LARSLLPLGLGLLQSLHESLDSPVNLTGKVVYSIRVTNR
jgi:hypothetical protein